MILLYSEQEHGQAHFIEAQIEGFGAPARRYTLLNHLMVVDGGQAVAGAEIIARHDAEELIAHGIYRLARPEEQNAYAAAQRKATSIEEAPAGGKASKKNTIGG